MTLTAQLSIEKLVVFPSMLLDDLLGQANLLLLNDGIHVRAIFVPKLIQHNLDFQGCFERSQFLDIGYNCYANHIDLSKQEILEEEIGEQFFWFKTNIANHQALKPGDYACKGSLHNPMVTWKDTPQYLSVAYL